MLSKNISKQMKEEAIHTEIVRGNKKIFPRKDQRMMDLSDLNLASQLPQRNDAFVLNFLGNDRKITDETLRRLSRTIKSMKKVRKIKISCLKCSLLTDEGMKNLGESLKGLSSLQSFSLNLESCKMMTDEGLRSLGEGLKRLNGLQTLNLYFEWSAHSFQLIEL